MRTPVPVRLDGETRRALDKIVAAATSQVRQVERARIVLLAAEGRSNPAIAAELLCNVNTARLWRNRFLAQGLAGLADAPGRGRKPTIVGAREAEIVAAALSPPENATPWSARRLAAKVKASKSAVRRVWQDYGLQPHREKTFKFSRDPLLVETVSDIIALHLSPPDKALVLCVDEKSQTRLWSAPNWRCPWRRQDGLPHSGSPGGPATSALHADVGLVDEPGRVALLDPDGAASETRQLHQRPGPLYKALNGYLRNWNAGRSKS